MNIQEIITSRIGNICPLFLGTAEVDVLPYVVYEPSTTPGYDKDGIYKESGEATVYIVADSAESAMGIRDQIKAAIAPRTSNFFARLVRQFDEQTDGSRWYMALEYEMTNLIN